MNVGTLRQGDHVCAVYERPSEQLRSVARYVKAGLKGGERCVYIADDRTVREVQDALAAEGVDVGAAQDSDRLILLTKRETYLANGSFDPDQMIAALSEMTEQALMNDCTGLRVTGEMTWALGPEVGCDRLMDYEIRLNRFFPGSRAHAICQYSRSRFPAAMIREVLRHHPLAVIGSEVYDNPYYEPPEILGVPEGDPRRVAHMLRQITARPLADPAKTSSRSPRSRKH